MITRYKISSAHLCFLAAAVIGLFMIAGPHAAASAEGSTAIQASDANAPKPPTVTVVPAEMQEIVATTLVSGTLVARDEILVAPQIEGLVITELLVDEGNEVQQGQVLARLDRRGLEVQLLQNQAQLARLEAGMSQAEAQIAEAEANKVQANASFNRAVQLQASGSSSAETLDQRAGAARGADARRVGATHAFSMIKAERQSALATIDDTRLKLARTEIKAPVAGIVSRRNAKLGAVATAVGDPLFKLIANAEIELEAEVSEVNLPRLKEGQPVKVSPSGASVALEGKIRLVSPEIDKTTRLGRIRVSLPRNSLAFVGSFARGSIETGRITALTVPLSALNYAKSGSVLQLVKDGVVSTRPVEVNLINNGRVSIKSGIEPGDTVVARAGTFVRDGDRVTVQMQVAEPAR